MSAVDCKQIHLISIVVDRLAQRLVCLQAMQKTHRSSHFVSSLKRCTSEVLCGDWFKPINGEFLCPLEMYVVRWVDETELSGASVLFVMTVSMADNETLVSWRVDVGKSF